MMIRLVDCNNRVHYVNPQYVTHIEDSTYGTVGRAESIWKVYVVSHAGYGTAGISVPKTPNTDAINTLRHWTAPTTHPERPAYGESCPTCGITYELNEQE